MKGENIMGREREFEYLERVMNGEVENSLARAGIERMNKMQLHFNALSSQVYGGVEGFEIALPIVKPLLMLKAGVFTDDENTKSRYQQQLLEDLSALDLDDASKNKIKKYISDMTEEDAKFVIMEICEMCEYDTTGVLDSRPILRK